MLVFRVLFFYHDHSLDGVSAQAIVNPLLTEITEAASKGRRIVRAHL
jgi:hypothetical protein